MNIKRIRNHSGPNIFSYDPVLVMRLEIEERDEAAWRENAGAAKRLAASTSNRGTTDRRKMRAIRLAENGVAEAVKNAALTLSAALGFGEAGGSVRFSGDPGVYEIAVQYQDARATEYLLETAVEWVASIIENEAFDADRRIAEARRLLRREDEPPFSGSDDARAAEVAARVPIAAITGTNGKTTTTRLIAHILRGAGLNVGTATTDGILMNGETVEYGDTTGPASARAVLNELSVDVAVLETARGGILRRGLGWEWADVAVVTNITEDHIGQDGIESVADLVDVKSLVAERVRAGGALVLNADDPESAALARRPAVAAIKKRLVYFALSEKSPHLERHLRDGETAYFADDGWICERVGDGSVLRIAETKRIPITMNGTADFQIQNALAAAAAARALDLTAQQIADGLYSFQNVLHNSGRSNFYRVGEGYALVDYGHNPKAMEAICRMTGRWEGKTVTGIISFPGDRRDDVIETAGRIAVAGFDRVIVKGDVNLRGRRSGEVAEMLCRIVLEAGNQGECEIVLDAAEAFEKAVAAIKKDEVIVFFYEKLPPVLATLEKYGAFPVDGFQAS